MSVFFFFKASTFSVPSSLFSIKNILNAKDNKFRSMLCVPLAIPYYFYDCFVIVGQELRQPKVYSFISFLITLNCLITDLC